MINGNVLSTSVTNGEHYYYNYLVNYLKELLCWVSENEETACFKMPRTCMVVNGHTSCLLKSQPSGAIFSEEHSP